VGAVSEPVGGEGAIPGAELRTGGSAFVAGTALDAGVVTPGALEAGVGGAEGPGELLDGARFAGAALVGGLVVAPTGGAGATGAPAAGPLGKGGLGGVVAPTDWAEPKLANGNKTSRNR
jgi:hypothetical protein